MLMTLAVISQRNAISAPCASRAFAIERRERYRDSDEAGRVGELLPGADAASEPESPCVSAPSMGSRKRSDLNYGGSWKCAGSCVNCQTFESTIVPFGMRYPPYTSSSVFTRGAHRQHSGRH